MKLRDEDMFAGMLKAAMERGIDVPQVIADILKRAVKKGELPAAPHPARTEEREP